MFLLQQGSSLTLAGDLEIPITPVRRKQAQQTKVSQEVQISGHPLTISSPHTYVNFPSICSITAITSRYFWGNVPWLADSL
jgi:hypothetical protein